MLSSAKSEILTKPYLLIFPGLCIAVTVLAINMFGDGLRDAMDPKLKD
jgi:ABC-type dipeptide/oligopeptide/nickel transport system permease subunit